MMIIKADSYKGKQLVAQGANWEGKFLHQVYDRWSDAKQRAWEACYEACINEGGTDFSIVSHNTFGFSVSWFTEQGMRYETPHNSYLVVFED